MKIIYRYILSELIQPFLFGVFAFTSIFIGSDVLRRLAGLMMDYGASLWTVTQLFFLSLPQIIIFTFPMSMLLATLLAFGRLSGDSEITALKAGGISFTKLIIPVLIVAFLVSGVTVWLSDGLVPLSIQVYEDLVWEIRRGEQRPTTQRNLRIAPVDSSTGRLDFVLVADKFDGATQTLEGVSWQDFEDGELVTIIQAKEAVWLEEQWQFIDGKIYRIENDGRVPQTEFERLNMQDKISRDPGDVSRSGTDPDEMTLGELRTHIDQMEEEGRDVSELLIIYHQRYAVPFASFIFAIVGAPLGLKPNRSGSSIGLGLSIIVVFIYYVLMTVGSALGQAGTVAPWLGAWLQNIVFAGVGAWLLAKKH
ncbi:LptF/LptG family permease [Natroniella sp. ANB-PHB2]|uniref:LptF/LptG family permease n=1 Tax=Natroniella sp. ANB-PHB2 TaxID=3384444 RepID=UPI0038D4B127